MLGLVCCLTRGSAVTRSCSMAAKGCLPVTWSDQALGLTKRESIQAKALAISTAVSAGAVAAAAAALHCWGGMPAPGAARVSSWQGALAVAAQQRVRAPKA